MDRRPVELVRVEREEQYFDREEVLGRDATSVFPTEAKKAATLDPEALKAAIGGDRKFISASEVRSQLEEIKARRGLTVEDGTLAPSKPLAEVLREAKEAKEQAFQDMWKQMKQGKNRPLDEDELEFLDSVADAAAEQERAVRQQEEEALAAFQEALREREEAKQAEEAAKQHPAAAVAHKPQHQKRPLPPVKPKAKPLVVVRRSGSSGKERAETTAACPAGSRAGQQQLRGSGEGEPGGANAGPTEGPPGKRQRAEEAGQDAVQFAGKKDGQGQQKEQQRPSAGGAFEEADVGLPGLLGGYGSGSGSDDSDT
ncbi:hypothetical protein N2152v2_005692 [Parachlorella kessleri]